MTPRLIIDATAGGCSRRVPVVVLLLVLAALLSACGGKHRASLLTSSATSHGPRGVAVGCSSAVYGDLAAGWRSPRQGAVIVGPIAWPYLSTYSKARPSSFASSHGLAPAVKALAVVNPGAQVTVSVPASERHRLSLDYTSVQPRAQTGNAVFRISDGASAITFTPCPGAQTQFAGGFIASGAQYAALDVETAGNPTLVRRYIALGVPRRSCTSARES